MNLRKITLKYMGWCPGVEAAAMFIPDKEIPDKRAKQVSYIGGLILLMVITHYYLTPPRSYAWDLDFKNAKYDEVYKMYVREAVGSFNGIYSYKMWAEAPVNTSVRVELSRLHSGTWHIFIFRNDMFYDAQFPIGSQYDKTWEFYGTMTWRVYSESRETVFHIRLEFLKYKPERDHL